MMGPNFKSYFRIEFTRHPSMYNLTQLDLSPSADGVTRFLAGAGARIYGITDTGELPEVSVVNAAPATVVLTTALPSGRVVCCVPRERAAFDDEYTGLAANMPPDLTTRDFYDPNLYLKPKPRKQYERRKSEQQ